MHDGGRQQHTQRDGGTSKAMIPNLEILKMQLECKILWLGALSFILEKVKSIKTTKIMSNRISDLRLKWDKPPTDKVADCIQLYQSCRPCPNNILWEPRNKLRLLLADIADASAKDDQSRDQYINEVKSMFPSKRGPKTDDSSYVSEEKKAPTREHIQGEASLRAMKEEADGSNSESVALDPSTQTLYRLYMQAIISGDSVNLQTRDCLIRSLHYTYRFETSKLS